MSYLRRILDCTVVLLLVGVGAALSAGEPEYLSPVALATTDDGGRLLVACEDAGVVLSVDTTSGTILGRAETGSLPRGLSLGPSDARLYVSVWGENVVIEYRLELDGRLTTTGRIEVGFGPRGLAVDRSGKVLFVANERSDDVSVIDLEKGQETARLLAGRRPREVALTPDGERLFVTSLLSLPVPHRSPPRLELTEIDTGTRRVVARHLLEGANLAQGVAVSPDGELVLATVTRPRNLVPFTQLAQGWGATSGLALLTRGTTGGVTTAQVSIDQPQRFYADPRAVAFSRDGRLAFVASSGCDTVSVVRVNALRKLYESATSEELIDYPDHLGLSRRFVSARLRVGSNPVAFAVSPDGKRLYVADRLDDAISVVDVEAAVSGEPALTQRIELNPDVPETVVRRGQRLFHDASVSFQGQLSCASCHPDQHIDGLTYDLEPDGIGRNILDNRSLLGLHGTAPFKWNGKNPDLATQDGPRAAKFIFRSVGFDARNVVAVTSYLRSLPPLPNPHRAADADLTAAQERGRVLFERQFDRFGRPLPENGSCIECHPPPLYTNRLSFDVGTAGSHDKSPNFDTPHLNNIWESAPYLHDGRAATLEEVWTVFGNEDRHGVVSDLSKRELNDLIEYLKTL